VGITRAFEMWKLQVSQQKQKHKIIERMLYRWRKYNASFLFNTLKQWAEKDRII